MNISRKNILNTVSNTFSRIFYDLLDNMIVCYMDVSLYQTAATLPGAVCWLSFRH